MSINAGRKKNNRMEIKTNPNIIFVRVYILSELKSYLIIENFMNLQTNFSTFPLNEIINQSSARYATEASIL